MKFLIIILSLYFFLPVSVQAQVSFGAQVVPQGLGGAKKEKNIINSTDAFTDTFVIEFTSAAACEVFKSTEPEKEIRKYIRKGFYRQEMIMLFFMARESSSSFKSLALDIEKGKTLEYLASKNKVNLMEIFKKSQKTKKAIEAKMPFYISPALVKPKTSDEKKQENKKNEENKKNK
ncbi:MAG: hypothetical protein KAR84_05845 [Elusimicrobiales bacterium]|nr:hypothetical protein [Elusimicrobiales bacterium]